MCAFETFDTDGVHRIFVDTTWELTAACKGEEEYRAANPGGVKSAPDHRSSIRGRGDGSGTAGKLELGTDGGGRSGICCRTALKETEAKTLVSISGAGIHRDLHGRAGGVSMASG